MWVEELTVENIRCFDKAVIRFGTKSQPYKWVNLIGENGAGKSTVLQALGLLLAGPEGAQQLLPRPEGWIKNPAQHGRIGIRIHQGTSDPGVYGADKKERHAFGYSIFITGKSRISIRGKQYSEPALVENPNAILTWLKQNAFTSEKVGWFSVGFGSFRRLTRKSEIIVPSLSGTERYTNFLTQFHEDEPLAALERWLVYLDYKIAKDRKDKSASRQFAIGVKAINHILPEGARFDSISSDGRIIFDVWGNKVPSIALSDGYRSALALAGDLIWRAIVAFPDSKDVLNEQGVILIDELDIHLHPTWQRNISSFLRQLFPNMQFIVATHSPLIAAGSGEDSVSYKMEFAHNVFSVTKVDNISLWDVDRILRSPAFGLVSTFSPETQKRNDRYLELTAKKKRTAAEEHEVQRSLPSVRQSLEFPPVESPVDKAISRIEALLKNGQKKQNRSRKA
jgi:energy-coupling factor transporter ATP-binding protein EcfA2